MPEDPIPRLNAALEGRYGIERELGEGGMATVYLATDLKHNRRVALKVLKPELAAVVGADRFLAEIETTAKLQHPHILPLFDSGEAGGFLFYVMPYVEGESLRERLEREHQLPVDEAVRVATNVAEALDYAHRQGVIHRDIKPANILLLDGKPVLADFGIALAVGAAGGGRLTETGLSLGTPHYMSPEQATGDQTIGVAADVYALGCVLYETLVGDPPYMGSTAQAILGKIISGQVASATEHRRSVPANVDAAIRKSLEKLPADRFATAAEFAKALADPGFRYGGSDVAGVGPSGSVQRVPVVAGVAAGLLVGVAVTALWFGTRETPAVDVMRFEIAPPESAPLNVIDGPMADLALSRDGRQIAYNGPDPDAARPVPLIYLRAIDQLVGGPVRGTEGGINPFFSPDGASLGFYDGETSRVLQHVSILGGAPVTVADAPAAIYGASWGADDRIVFGVAGPDGGLFRVSSGGGEPERLTQPEAGQEQHHLWPSIIDGEEAVLFVIIDGNDVTVAELAVLDLKTREVKRLGIGGTAPRYVATGHLVYTAASGSLRAAPFDVHSLELTGSPVELVQGLRVKGAGAAEFDVSDGGRLVYALGPAFRTEEAGLRHFVWVDRDGHEEALPVPPGIYTYPRLSPDGRQIATSVSREPGWDLWVYDVATGAGLPLTEGEDINWIPIWSPEGRTVYFSSTNGAPQPESFTGTTWYGNVYSVPANGSARPQRLTETEENQALTGVSPDGRTLVYSKVIDNNTRWDIMALPSDGSAEPTALVAGASIRGTGTVSPDGKWLAYRSTESGQWEVYVQPYPGPGARVPVSIGGGVQPVWSADGRELFYRRPSDDMMMAATITGDDTPLVSERTELFSAVPYIRGTGPRLYHVAPDGRFLMLRVNDGSAAEEELGTTEITVVLNWFEELRQRVPN